MAKSRSPHEWKIASNQRNGYKGRLIGYRSGITGMLKSDLISVDDQLTLSCCINTINKVLNNWDKHYIRKLRAKVEGRKR